MIRIKPFSKGSRVFLIIFVIIALVSIGAMVFFNNAGGLSSLGYFVVSLMIFGMSSLVFLAVLVFNILIFCISKNKKQQK